MNLKDSNPLTINARGNNHKKSKIRNKNIEYIDSDCNNCDMKAVLRLSFAILAFAFGLPERGYSEGTRQWVQHFGVPDKVLLIRTCSVFYTYINTDFET